jgi:hypothetical protein
MFANLDDSHVTVVMYSKFSQCCSAFLEILTKVPTFKHTLLCIDNDDIRKRVLSPQSKLNVTEVPCIFRIYERTGYVETFEGERAFTILNTHYNHYLEKLEKEQLLRSSPPASLSPPQQTQLSQLLQQPQQTYQQQPQQTYQQQPPQLPPSPQQTQPLPQQTQLQSPPQSYEFDIASQPPPTTMSSTQIDQLEPYMASNPGLQQVDRAVVKSGTVNIVSRAMQMQKEREVDGPKRQ